MTGHRADGFKQRNTIKLDITSKMTVKAKWKVDHKTIGRHTYFQSGLAQRLV